jgi:hypothetical protein
VQSKTLSLVACIAFTALIPRGVRGEPGGTQIVVPIVVPIMQSPGMGPDQTRPSPGARPDEEDEGRLRAERDMAKRANQQRQAQLKRDTEHLLKLANELQEYVEKSNESILSLDVIKKAEEIEKLAHSVKEKMKGQ